MAGTTAPQGPKLDRYVVMHIATTCDEHGVYVTKDSAEVIEIGWILLDSKTCEEVRSCLGQVKTQWLTGLKAAQREHPGQTSQHAHHTPVQ